MLISNAVILSLVAVTISSGLPGQESGLTAKRHTDLAARAFARIKLVPSRTSKRDVTASEKNNTRNSCKAKVQAKASVALSSSSTKSSAVSSASKAVSTKKATGSGGSGGGGGGGGGSSSSGGGGGGQVIKTPGTFTPNGIKAGIAGGDSYQWMEPYIGSWYDWSPNPHKSGKPYGIPMLWGGGGSGSRDASRLEAFKHIDTPKYVLGFEEPDCAAGGGSSGMSVSQGVQLWNQYIGPLKAKGTVLASPSMCHQAAEKGWLKPFQDQIKVDWDITNIHINKVDRAGVLADIDHYANTYGKPIWVSEFACVDDQNGFTPCTDQGQINDYINMIVPLFEADSRILAYHYSDGEGLGSVWPSTRNGQLSASGQTYLNAIKKYA